MNPAPRRSLAIVATGVLIAAVLVVVALSHGGDERADGTLPARAPAPVVVHGDEHDQEAPALGNADRAAARRTALAFVRTYLPVLYGQKTTRGLTMATADLRRSLRGVREPPRAVRRRHPRLQRIQLTIQTSRSVVANATVRDGVAPPFDVVFTIERRGSAWIVSDLASD
jgi:hypothetical protein